MKKLAILVVACALAVGVAACGKKKDTSTPATDVPAGDSGNVGGDAYGGDAYGAPAAPEGEANPCGGAANPCG